MKTTKHILLIPLLALSFLTIHCSGSDDNLPNNKQEPEVPTQTKHFHPPLWIQGVWSWKLHSTAPIQRIRFTKDDIISLPDNASYSDEINKSKTTDLIMTVEDEGISNTLYYYSIARKRPNSNEYVGLNEFRVQKKNDTVMVRSPDFSAPIYYTKEKD
jgi:hypothetical protein